MFLQTKCTVQLLERGETVMKIWQGLKSLWERRPGGQSTISSSTPEVSQNTPSGASVRGKLDSMPTVLEARCYLTRENPEQIMRYYDVRGANNHSILMTRPIRAIHLRVGSRVDVRGLEVPVREFGLHAVQRTALEASRQTDYTAALKVDVQQVLAYCILHDLPLWLFEGSEILELHTPVEDAVPT